MAAPLNTQAIVDLINQSCPCRSKEISTILKLIGDRDETTPSSMFIYGHTSTGKTHVIKTILTELSLPHVFVNCIESFTSKLLYQEILSAVYAPGAADNAPKSCATMTDFVRHLKQSRLAELAETFYIVLDRADRLRGMDAHLLPAFCALNELTRLNVCVVLVSEIAAEKFLRQGALRSPVRVHFSNYTKRDAHTILSMQPPGGVSAAFYTQYLHILLDVFASVCRNLGELRHLAAINFDKYCEPVRSGEVVETDVRRLWKQIMPHLRRALQTVYLQAVSSTQWEAMQSGEASDEKAVPIGGKVAVELPYYSKYLLIAAFVASYNPATTDRRFFSKKRFERLSKQTKTSIKKAKNADKKFLGPKAFPLDRLMALFYSIVEGGAAPSAMILSQISTLVTLNLITRTSADDQIDAAKYKCRVTLEFALHVSKQVDFDLIQYLYDT